MFKEVFKNYDLEYGVLDESGINRVLRKIKEEDFLMITAFRGTYSLKENQKRNNNLIKDIRSTHNQKLGAYKMVGHWKECTEPLDDNQTLKDCAGQNGKIKNVLEETWLIVRPDEITKEDFNRTAMKLAKKYQQDAYVIKEDEIFLRGKDGSTWANLGGVTDNSLKIGFAGIADIQGYSELKKDRTHGRTNNIVFEGFEGLELFAVVPDCTNSSRMIFKYGNIMVP